MRERANPAGPPVRLERETTIAVIVIDNPPVNASTRDVRRALLEAVDAVNSDPGLTAAVIIGAGRTFISGSDIKEFGGTIAEPTLPDVIAAIGAGEKPFVAAIHGAALGGGFELALGCDARLADKDAVVGLPEVTLGMIPGAGGSQYLARLVGVARAIELICSARRIPAPEALRLGLIDAVIETDLRREALAHARGLTTRRRLRDATVLAGDAGRIAEAAAVALRQGRNRPHIAAAIAAIRSAASLPFDQAITAERAVFERLRLTGEAAALRYLFFAERRAAKIAGLAGAQPRAILKVGIVGAGTMGTGIATCFADAGWDVTVIDRDEATLGRAFDRIRLHYQRRVKTGRLEPSEVASRLSRITSAIGLEALSGCDLVVEAVFEDMDVKKAVLAALDRLLAPEAILASNTSYLDLDALAGATARPDRIVGLHFFNPAPAMRLLEVVRGRWTSAMTLATALAVAKRLEKLAIVARVGEGFIGNRVFAAYRRQCEFMLEEGAYPEAVDAALEAFGFAMGPFKVADASGLDIAWRMRQRLASSRDPRSRYVDIADRLCEAGRLGQKAGAGWYRYGRQDRNAEPDPFVHHVIEASSQAKGIVRRAIPPGEIRSRALLAMVNEAALLLSEGIAERPSDVDLAMVHGYGFPAFEGGPLFWAKRQDQASLLKQLEELQVSSGPGFRSGDIAAALEKL